MDKDGGDDDDKDNGGKEISTKELRREAASIEEKILRQKVEGYLKNLNGALGFSRTVREKRKRKDLSFVLDF